ncbi:hypothetical protein TWF730_007657 [Orbilia blumenaviensis]|uniref:Uncharacterized protein n=1 Tax=Orbilia blumenaviensis TaxID=1796055 RepID=A0AAV9VBP7_9PEZI
MHFSLLPPAALLFLFASLASADHMTVTIFPAIPEVTEIVVHSSLVAMVGTAAVTSTDYAIGAKRAKPTPGVTSGFEFLNTDFYIDVTTYPSKNSQVLNYYTGIYPFTQVAEVTCSFEGTTSAVCQVTRLAEPTGTYVGEDSLVSSTVTYAPAQMTFVPVSLKEPTDENKIESITEESVQEAQGQPVSSASSLKTLRLPGLVASMVAVAVMLL